MRFPVSGCFGRALLPGHRPFKTGMKNISEDCHCCLGAVAGSAESDKPPNGQNQEDISWRITDSVFCGIVMFYCMSKELSLSPS